MAKNKSRKSQASLNREQQVAEAQQIARGIQEEGQSKEQKRAIARGIAKGIALYKKQHKTKAREVAKAQRRRETERLSAAAAARPPVQRRRPVRSVTAVAVVGATVIAGLVIAMAADVLAARSIASQLASEAATPAQFERLLPDTTPVGLLRRGFVLDAVVRCDNARLYYGAAGVSIAGRTIWTDADGMMPFFQYCAARTRD